MNLSGANEQTTLLLRKLDTLRLFTYTIKEGEIQQVSPHVTKVVKNIAQSDISLDGFRLVGVRQDGSDLLHRHVSIKQVVDQLARYLSGAASRVPAVKSASAHRSGTHQRIQRIHHSVPGPSSVFARDTFVPRGVSSTAVYDELSLAFKRASLLLHGSVASAGREFNSRYVARLQNSAAPTIGHPILPSDGIGIDAEVAPDAFFFVVKGVTNPSYSPMFFAVLAL